VLTYGLLLAASISILLLFGRTVWALRRFAYRPIDVETDDLPTVSVCIAARNETHALAQCLERVLKSDYQKLEILVLDDSSGDDTSLIIKSFASAGVRFIAGTPVPDGWLGKNHAYQTLINEASGELVLFLDVDTTVAVTSITQLVNQSIANKKPMVSVLPRREDSYRMSAILGTMRYYWELLLASRLSPPAASALWMVDRRTLNKAGIGLSHYGLSVRPERHLARQLQRTKGYYYLIGTKALGVGFEKHIRSQHETAVRLYYPMTGRGIVGTTLSFLFLASLLIPIIILFVTMPEAVTTIWALSLILLCYVSFGLFISRTYDTINWRLRLFAWPLLILQELALLTTSLVSYTRGTVTWKGRPVRKLPARQDSLRSRHLR
jgi:glycosyltransferase involved in cell wall biosynthesis